MGIRPVLHVFTYGRNKIVPLKNLASEVYVYERIRRPFDLFSALPFIVKTRKHVLLKKRLNEAETVLFEGIHTTGFVGESGGIRKILRAHNYETAYYEMLSRSSGWSWKKLYYALERRKLDTYEPVVIRAVDAVLSVSPKEQEIFSAWNRNSFWLPVFHPFDEVKLTEETEEIILFHGNLSVEENREAVRFLWKEVFRNTAYPFVVAGKNPPDFMQRWNKRYDRFYLIPNPREEKLRKLIARARVNVIWSNAQTGIKLKLIHALFRGKNVVANRNVTSGTGLEPLVEQADDAVALRERVNMIFASRSDLSAIRNKREALLRTFYDNQKNIKRLLQYVR